MSAALHYLAEGLRGGAAPADGVHAGRPAGRARAPALPRRAGHLRRGVWRAAGGAGGARVRPLRRHGARHAATAGAPPSRLGIAATSLPPFLPPLILAGLLCNHTCRVVVTRVASAST